MPQAASLPDPDSRPQADVVIFDGQCQFCQSQVRRLVAIDTWAGIFGASGRLAYMSLHDPRVQERYPDLTHEMLMEQMYVVDSAGRRHGGADAVRYLSRRLPLLWPVMPILHIPGTARLWRWMYAQVARRRYRWNRNHGGDTCENDACAVHFGGPARDADEGSAAHAPERMPQASAIRAPSEPDA